MFRGVNPINLDAKGRMALPARYRDSVREHCGGKMVVTIDTEDRCLLLYPQPEWDEIQAKIDALPSFNKAVRRIQRLLTGHATDLELDANGRMLLPAPLRDYARLDKKVVLLGQGNKFEIWSEELWNSTRDEYLQVDDEDDIPPELQSLSL
ncbi:division/cell wall cluster transcriptional repressor MraZ [Marinobacterium sediminicola]|uniref:Transcriptional regulator MraZ n=1 Tax=Marinobacterium sediminicola TaxID=518898 RepID=A0ABY1RWR1_9GAMM|nr:division/cell wall cluster transcriptional repressor MraZ [Marinobacterium sediminicola]ULG70212.1 division/cell wall cluster transcriptional repressor MraZ [Marinobacterium sediminicola]SMR70082.1 MraZ protein [Marinobacterium sediminicola]